MRIRTHRRAAALAIAGLLLASCNAPTPIQPTAAVPAPTSIPATPAGAATVAASATVAATASTRPLTSPLPTPTALPVNLQGRLVFASDETGLFQISVATFPGGAIKNLTSSPNAGDAEPRWSPDGAYIVFNSGRIAEEGFGIYRMAPDGSSQTKLIAIAGKRSLNFAPQVSPDGKKLLFHTNRDGNFEVYVANVDGSGLKNLTNEAGNDITPGWSRAGDLIAWSANRIGDGYQVYVAKPDGSGVRQVVSAPSSNTARPTFSPDGKRLAFSIQAFTGLPSKIAVVNIDGTGFRVLDLGPGAFQMGDWIDDDTLLYSWRNSDSERSRIVASKLDGSNRQVLISVGGDALYPSWYR
ncbi:MAG: PD40 domain-containing protein [Thermoflexales bacterium]|nr:PD40 domain-containing protein [Thermoflexales bacterium]